MESANRRRIRNEVEEKKDCRLRNLPAIRLPSLLLPPPFPFSLVRERARESVYGVWLVLGKVAYIEVHGTCSFFTRVRCHMGWNFRSVSFAIVYVLKNRNFVL